MPFDVGSVAAATGWAAFCLQLPAIVLVIAVVVVGLAAILKARPEDIPAIFASFAAAVSRHPARRELPGSGRRRRGQLVRDTTTAESEKENA
ncbi:hypothetical protein ACIBEH_32760 [Nocardia salmonicida]|uniref:hypothetical protein n=1 Tax=Nocardia salmonicida TaxID=53431 RepID=UPI0037A242A9